jgi:hypothetical protein
MASAVRQNKQEHPKSVFNFCRSSTATVCGVVSGETMNEMLNAIERTKSPTSFLPG